MLKTLYVEKIGTVLDPEPENLTIPFSDETEYVIKKIDGLGPTKLDVSNSKSPIDAGSTIYKGQQEFRNIVITMGFNTLENSITVLRNNLSKVFMPGEDLHLRFEKWIEEDQEFKWFEIKGSVESHEPDIFSKDPQVTISVICGDPHFTDGILHYIEFDEPERMGPENLLYYPVFYEGDVPVGFELEMKKSTASGMNAPSTRIYQHLVNPTTSYRNPLLGTTRVLNNTASNTLRFSTIRGTRGAWFGSSTQSYKEINGSNHRSLLGSLTEAKLQPGNNYFHIVPNGDTLGLPPKSPFSYVSIRYTAMYGGL